MRSLNPAPTAGISHVQIFGLLVLTSVMNFILTHVQIPTSWILEVIAGILGDRFPTTLVNLFAFVIIFFSLLIIFIITLQYRKSALSLSRLPTVTGSVMTTKAQHPVHGNDTD